VNRVNLYVYTIKQQLHYYNKLEKLQYWMKNGLMNYHGAKTKHILDYYSAAWWHTLEKSTAASINQTNNNTHVQTVSKIARNNQVVFMQQDQPIN